MDLAEVVEDLICTVDGTGDTTMDTLAMFVFGWILAALFILWLGRLLYDKLQARSKDAKLKVIETPAKTTDNVDAVSSKKIAPPPSKGAAGGGYVPPTPPVRKRITRQSPAPEVRKQKYVPAPTCTGPDNVCVLWVNDVLQWLYSDFVIVNELLAVWIHELNEFARKSSEEVSYLFIYL